MVQQRAHFQRPAAPAAPASPPRPQWQPISWSFPFASIDGNAADPQTWLNALARADGGFYPLGANGMFHGGIHFDAGTGGKLRQGDGVKAIADGEVVAYRLDSAWPELTWRTTPPRYALYSTGFVLIRHRLVLPPAPCPTEATDASAPTSPLSGASTTVSSGPQKYSPPADEVLEFYSLYMHQLDWKGYQNAQTEGSNPPASSSRPLPFWLGDRFWRVDARANDRQAQPPPLNTPFRFDLAPAGTDAPTTDNGAQLGSIASGPSPDLPGTLEPYADGKLRYALQPDSANASTAPQGAQGAQGVHILDHPNGTVIGLLPRGCELSVLGNAANGWAQIAKIIRGIPVAAVAGGTPDPRATTGWVNLDALDTVVDPKPLDTVVVLDSPYPVKAGDVVGHLGEYQDARHAQLLPPRPMRPLLHVEVFTGAPIEDFIRKSRERAKKLPEGGKTLLVVQRGAKLARAVEPTRNERLAGLMLAPAKGANGDPGRGRWALVQPTRPAPQSGTRGHDPGGSRPAGGTPVGDALWVERKHAGKTAGAMVEIWTAFPLQLAEAQGSVVACQRVLSRAWLEQLPETSKATDNKGAQWWLIEAGDEDGRTILRGVCERSHPDTQWQSPWSWPGFDTVDTTSIPVLDLYRRNLFEAKQLLNGEEEFSIVAATVNAGPPIGKLEKAAKRQGSDKGNVVPADLKKALMVPWLAEAISHLIVRYESEWGGDMSKWEKLSSLMGKDGEPVWLTELDRIKNCNGGTR